MSEEITGHPAIDVWLKCYKPQLSKKDYAKFCSMLSALKSDEQQLRHKLRELILGGFLAKRGFTVEYEREHYGQTPEWTIFKDSKMIAIAEVRNFHGDIKIENEIRKGGTEGLTMASGYRVAFGENVFVFAYLPSCRDKVWAPLREKFEKYKQLANKLDVPYIVGFAIEYVAAAMIEPKDVLDAVHNEEYGLFKAHPEVSGLYHFADADFYQMRYEPNPHASRPLPNMPEGDPGTAP